MSDLHKIEKLKLEKLLDMSEGYVLDFSNRTFSEFILDSTNLEVYHDKYQDRGDSKANRLRTFWDKESNYIVGKLILDFLEYWRTRKLLSYKGIDKPEQDLFDACEKIALRLKEDNLIAEIEVIKENVDDRSITLLAKSIRESIAKNEPETALDRLHTYVMKFFRNLCEKHTIAITKEETLNAIFGKYVKYIVSCKKVDSLMAEKILKYSISILDAFNDVRNNRSFAHDNNILNYEESVLIFNNITNSLKYIESIESKIDKEKLATAKKGETVDWGDLPF
jgi:hypothetical protein